MCPLTKLNKHFNWASYNIFENLFTVNESITLKWLDEDLFMVIKLKTGEAVYKGDLDTCIDFVKKLQSTDQPGPHLASSNTFLRLPR